MCEILKNYSLDSAMKYIIYTNNFFSQHYINIIGAVVA
jgi:hypothetical protein